MSEFVPLPLQSSPALLKANEDLEARLQAIFREEQQRKEQIKLEAQKSIEQFYQERNTKILENKKSNSNNVIINEQEGNDIWNNVHKLVQFQKSNDLSRMENVISSLANTNFIAKESKRSILPIPKQSGAQQNHKENNEIKKAPKQLPREESSIQIKESKVDQVKEIPVKKEAPIVQEIAPPVPSFSPPPIVVKEDVQEPPSIPSIPPLIPSIEEEAPIVQEIAPPIPSFSSPPIVVKEDIQEPPKIPEIPPPIPSEIPPPIPSIAPPSIPSPVQNEIQPKEVEIEHNVPELSSTNFEIQQTTENAFDPFSSKEETPFESNSFTENVIPNQETNANTEFNFESNFSNDNNNDFSNSSFGEFSTSFESNSFEFTNSDNLQNEVKENTFDPFFSNSQPVDTFETAFQTPTESNFEPSFTTSFESSFSSNFQTNFDSSASFNTSFEASFDSSFDDSFNVSFERSSRDDDDDFSRDRDDDYFSPNNSKWDEDNEKSHKSKSKKKVSFIDIILKNNEESTKILIQQVSENNIDLLNNIIENLVAKEIVKNLIERKITGENGKSLLHIACSNGSFKWCEFLLELGHKEEVDNSGNTPLHDSINSQNGFRIASLLLSEPYLFNPNPRNDKQRTPLHEACIRSSSKCVQLLSASNADKLAQDAEGQTPLHLACLSSSLSTVEALFKDGEFDVKLKDNAGRTPLHAAAHSCSWQICKALMNRGLNVADRDNNGLDPLLWALSQEKKLIDTQEDSCLECIESFLRFSSVDIQDIKLRTPLHYAAFANLPKCVNFLLSKNANVNVLDRNGQSPLFSAVSSSILDHQCYEVVESLINAGADANIISTSNSRTVLHLAAISSKEKTLLYILSKCNPDTISYLDIYHKSVAHYSSENNLYKSTIKILQQEPSLLQIKDSKNRNLLHYICKGGALDVYNWLYKNHIDQLKTWVLEKDTSDIYPIHLSCLEGNVDIIQSIVSLLGDKKDEIINAKDKNGNLPIHYAATGGKEWAIDTLINELNCSVNVENNEKMTPLHLTAKSDSPQVVGLFTVAGVNVDCKDAKGRTPLHLAILRKNFPIACELFRKGANINEKDNNNLSPLEIASKLKLHEKIKEMLASAEDNFF